MYIETVYNYNINCFYECYNKRINFVKPCHCIVFNILGAFGVVHKGEMIASDGTLKAVAIKTIKCQFRYYYIVYHKILAGEIFGEFGKLNVICQAKFSYCIYSYRIPGVISYN